MNDEHIKTEINDKIGTVTFSHPKGNALPRESLTRLTQAIKELDQDKKARVILLQSTGEKTFCGGAYFKDLMDVNNKEEGKHFFMGFANVLNAMRTSSKLIIGRVQGKAVGGGVGLAAGTDYTLATKDAAVRLSELKLGIGPFVVGPAIRRKMGVQGFTALSLDPSTWRSAEWAYGKGLYTELLDSINDLDEETKRLANQLSEYNPKAMKELKRALWDDATNWKTLLEIRADTSGRLLMTDFAQSILDDLD